jgi:hypothetical protein
MAESYSRTLVETTAAMLLIPKPAGVLENNRHVRWWDQRCYRET